MTKVKSIVDLDGWSDLGDDPLEVEANDPDGEPSGQCLYRIRWEGRVYHDEAYDTDPSPSLFTAYVIAPTVEEAIAVISKVHDSQISKPCWGKIKSIRLMEKDLPVLLA